MTSERRYLWIAATVVAVTVTLLFAIPKLRQELAPELRSALVAVAVGDSDVARVGLVEISVSQPFTLHAVLVAEDRAGRPIYYTEAAGLEIAGEIVPAERIRRWRDVEKTVVLWFTVEGYRPFIEPSSPAELESYRWEEAFRPDWGRGWSAVGSVEPRNRNLARVPREGDPVTMGTARYHVRIERYFRLGDPMPMGRYRSPGAAELPENLDAVTGVVARLPGGLETVSEVFGLPHVEPAVGSPAELLRSVASLFHDRLAFSRLLVLDQLLAAHGLVWADLRWASVDIQERPSWGAPGAGDLLRSGERVVVLYEDRGAAGILDYEDLCLDYVENAAVRPLGEVFRAGGVLDWTNLQHEQESET